MPLADSGYDFGSKIIIIQQYSPSNPSVVYPSYDVKIVIDKKDGVIELPDLEGTYNSEEVYVYFKISFS